MLQQSLLFSLYVLSERANILVRNLIGDLETVCGLQEFGVGITSSNECVAKFEYCCLTFELYGIQLG